MALKEPVKSVRMGGGDNSGVTLDHSSALNDTESMETEQAKWVVSKVERVRRRNNYGTARTPIVGRCTFRGDRQQSVIIEAFHQKRQKAAADQRLNHFPAPSVLH